MSVTEERYEELNEDWKNQIRPAARKRSPSSTRQEK